MRGGQRHHRATWTSECGLDDQLFSLFFPNQGEPKERSVGMDFWVSAIKSRFHFSLEVPMMPLFALIFLAGKSTVPCLGGGRGAFNEARHGVKRQT